MTIDEYTKTNDLPKMKIMGEMKNFRYYIEANLNSSERTGIPMVIEENKISHTFEIVDADRVLDLMSYFYGEK